MAAKTTVTDNSSNATPVHMLLLKQAHLAPVIQVYLALSSPLRLLSRHLLYRLIFLWLVVRGEFNITVSLTSDINIT